MVLDFVLGVRFVVDMVLLSELVVFWIVENMDEKNVVVGFGEIGLVFGVGVRGVDVIVDSLFGFVFDFVFFCCVIIFFMGDVFVG